MSETQDNITIYTSGLEGSLEEASIPIKNGVRVSVIIPTLNESYCIGDLLDSLMLQEDSNFEVIVVDNGSTDHTRMLIEAYRQKVNYPLYLLEEHHPGPGFARKRGMDFVLRRLQSFGRTNTPHYLAIADADVVVPINWVNNTIQKFGQDETIGALAGVHGASGTINAEIEKAIGVSGYFNLVPQVIMYLQNHGIGRIKMSSSNAAFSAEAYAVAGGMIQPYNQDGTMGLHEAALLGERIREEGFTIAAMNLMVRSRQRRHLYDLLHNVSSYYIYDQGRFLSIREDEQVLLQVALHSVSREQWVRFREEMLIAVLDNILFRPYQQSAIAIEDLIKLLADEDFIQDLANIQNLGSREISKRYAMRIARKIITDLGLG